MTTVGDIVLPGDDITELIKARLMREEEKYVIGPGLQRVCEQIKAIKYGSLMFRDRPVMFWIETRQKRYVPVRGERVVGTVVSKGSFTARIDIGANDLASLNLLAFEGATKKNRPNISVGDVVFARILTANKDVETELVCVTGRNKKDGMGVLNTPPAGNSFVVNVPLQTIRRVLNTKCDLLPTLGKRYRFELAAGMNGNIWISSNSLSTTLFVCNTLAEVEHLSDGDLEVFSTQVLNQFETVSRKR